MGNSPRNDVELFEFFFKLESESGFRMSLDQWQKDPLIWYFQEKKRGRHLSYVNDVMKDDFDVVLAAVKADGLALEFAGWRLRGNLEIVSAATMQNGKALRFVR
jgi:uncharacterized protein YihD (DUF1040 family)